MRFFYYPFFSFIEIEKYLNRVVRIHFLYCTWKHAKGRKVKIARSKVANITRNVSERIHAKESKERGALTEEHDIPRGYVIVRGLQKKTR